MGGSPATRPAPELPAESRLALVVATTAYSDLSLRQLRAPAQDAAGLAEILADPDIGGFAVTPVINRPAQEIRVAVVDFLADRNHGDLLVVYLSCHGLVDARRRLYFAATDTIKSRLAATGVEAQWLLEQLDDCRARRQVVILDCCFSGAFAHGSKGDTDLGLQERLHGAGRGRVVLTASRATEYSFEGDPLPGAETAGSVFTAALADGLRTGAADADRDGYVSVDEAHAYAFARVQAAGAAQTPQRWLYGGEGTILLARSPAGVTITPAVLPEAVRAGLDNPYPAVRLGAVATLGEWLTDPDPGRVLTARQTLQPVADADIPSVAAAARTLLDTHPPDGQPPAAGDAETAPTAPPGESPGGVAREPPSPGPDSERAPPSGPESEQAPPASPGPESEPVPPAAERVPLWRRLAPSTSRARAVLALAGTLLVLSAVVVVLVRLPSGAPSADPTPTPTPTQSPRPTQVTASFLRSLPGPTSGVVGVAFSPDGKILAGAGVDETVRLWNPTTGAAIGDPLRGHTGDVRNVAFSPDGKTLASTSLDGTVRLWNPTTGDPVRTDTVDTQGVFPVAFSPKGQVLAAGCADGTVWLWNPVSAAGRPLPGHTGPVRGVAFSPDGKILASSSADGTVRRWDATTGESIGTPLTRHAGEVYGVAFSPDGKILATGNADHMVRIWNATTGGLLHTLRGHTEEAFGVAFSPDGKILASSGHDKRVQLWNPATGGRIGQPLTGHTKIIYGVAFSPDGKILATGSIDGTVRLWKITKRGG